MEKRARQRARSKAARIERDAAWIDESEGDERYADSASSAEIDNGDNDWVDCSGDETELEEGHVDGEKREKGTACGGGGSDQSQWIGSEERFWVHLLGNHGTTKDRRAGRVKNDNAAASVAVHGRPESKEEQDPSLSHSDSF